MFVFVLTASQEIPQYGDVVGHKLILGSLLHQKKFISVAGEDWTDKIVTLTREIKTNRIKCIPGLFTRSRASVSFICEEKDDDKNELRYYILRHYCMF